VYVDKNHENVFVNNSQRVTHLLAESEKVARAGNRQYAYDLSLQATQLAPDHVEAWLLRATLAPSLEERLFCVNHLNELAPGYQDRYNVAFFALKELLDKNPFLAYLEETDDLYRVRNTDRFVLSIPKKRAPVNSFPPEGSSSSPLRAAYRWLTLSFLGLLLAGIGTVIFAPLAGWSALQAQRSVDSQPERVSSTVVLIVAFLLFIIGVIFSLLFILHWLG
jgi:hypothetical protein